MFQYKEEGQFRRMELSNTNRKNSLKKLRQEIKAVVMENHDFENRGEI